MSSSSSSVSSVSSAGAGGGASSGSAAAAAAAAGAAAATPDTPAATAATVTLHAGAIVPRRTADGRRFFTDRVSGRASWHDPRRDESGGWSALEDDASTHTYWYHPGAGHSTWSSPRDPVAQVRELVRTDQWCSEHGDADGQAAASRLLGVVLEAAARQRMRAALLNGAVLQQPQQGPGATKGKDGALSSSSSDGEPDTPAKSFVPTVRALVQGGFTLNEQGVAFCPACALSVARWVEDSTPLQEHENLSPTCPFLLALGLAAAEAAAMETAYCPFVNTADWTVEMPGEADAFGGGAEQAEIRADHPSYYVNFFTLIQHSNFLCGTAANPCVISAEDLTSKMLIRTPEWTRMVTLDSRDRKLSLERRVKKGVAELLPAGHAGNFFVVDSAAIVQRLEEFDKLFADQREFEVGVLRCPPGTTTYKRLVRVGTDSPALRAFLAALTEEGTEGGGGAAVHTTKWRQFALSFVVAPHLPADDRRKKIDAAPLTVIFQENATSEEGEDTVLDLGSFSPQHLVHILVEPIRAPHGGTVYRVSSASRSGIPAFQPTIPSAPLAAGGGLLRDFLMAKIVNAQRTSQLAPVFRAQSQRKRRAFLAAILRDFSPRGKRAAKSLLEPDESPFDEPDVPLGMLADRLASFEEHGWPHASPTPNVLARAGFYLLPPTPSRKDRARCFKCGKVLFEWGHDDDPVTVHRAANPGCPLLEHAEAGRGAARRGLSHRLTSRAVLKAKSALHVKPKAQPHALAETPPQHPRSGAGRAGGEEEEVEEEEEEEEDDAEGKGEDDGEDTDAMSDEPIENDPRFATLRDTRKTGSQPRVSEFQPETVWEAWEDSDGRPYLYNPFTGEVVYEDEDAANGEAGAEGEAAGAGRRRKADRS